MIANETAGCSVTTASKSQRREGETHGRLVGHDLCDTRPPVQYRQLAEEVARADARDGRSIADDADGPPSDHEEARADLALAGDHVVRRELDLDDSLGDRVEPGSVDAGEQRSAGQ